MEMGDFAKRPITGDVSPLEEQPGPKKSNLKRPFSHSGSSSFQPWKPYLKNGHATVAKAINNEAMSDLQLVNSNSFAARNDSNEKIENSTFDQAYGHYHKLKQAKQPSSDGDVLPLEEQSGAIKPNLNRLFSPSGSSFLQSKPSLKNGLATVAKASNNEAMSDLQFANSNSFAAQNGSNEKIENSTPDKANRHNHKLAQAKQPGSDGDFLPLEEQPGPKEPNLNRPFSHSGLSFQPWKSSLKNGLVTTAKASNNDAKSNLQLAHSNSFAARNDSNKKIENSTSDPTNGHNRKLAQAKQPDSDGDVLPLEEQLGPKEPNLNIPFSHSSGSSFQPWKPSLKNVPATVAKASNNEAKSDLQLTSSNSFAARSGSNMKIENSTSDQGNGHKRKLADTKQPSSDGDIWLLKEQPGPKIPNLNRSLSHRGLSFQPSKPSLKNALTTVAKASNNEAKSDLQLTNYTSFVARNSSSKRIENSTSDQANGHNHKFARVKQFGSDGHVLPLEDQPSSKKLNLNGPFSHSGSKFQPWKPSLKNGLVTIAKASNNEAKSDLQLANSNNFAARNGSNERIENSTSDQAYGHNCKLVQAKQPGLDGDVLPLEVQPGPIKPNLNRAFSPSGSSFQPGKPSLKNGLAIVAKASNNEAKPNLQLANSNSFAAQNDSNKKIESLTPDQANGHYHKLAQAEQPGSHGSTQPNKDPKWLNRLMANRVYSKRYRMKKNEQLTNLEEKVKSLQNEIAVLHPQVTAYSNTKQLLMSEQQNLKLQMATREKERILQEEEIERNKEEMNRLRELQSKQIAEANARMLNMGTTLRRMSNANLNDASTSASGHFLGSNSNQAPNAVGPSKTMHSGLVQQPQNQSQVWMDRWSNGPRSTPN